MLKPLRRQDYFVGIIHFRRSWLGVGTITQALDEGYGFGERCLKGMPHSQFLQGKYKILRAAL